MSRYSVNKVTLLGNLGGDPELRYTADGQAVATFSLATSRGRQDASGGWVDVTEWHRVVCREKTAEVAAEHLHKGGKCYVEGRIQSRKYRDRDNVERTAYEIVCTDLTLIDRPARSDDAPAGNAVSVGTEANTQRRTPTAPAPARQPISRQSTIRPIPEDEWGDDPNDVPFD